MQQIFAVDNGFGNGWSKYAPYGDRYKLKWIYRFPRRPSAIIKSDELFFLYIPQKEGKYQFPLIPDFSNFREFQLQA